METPRLSLVLATLAATSCVLMPSPDVDRQLGEQGARQVAEEVGLVDDPALANYVDSVGQRVAAAVPGRQFSYRFQVVDQAEPNAFAVPGGYIYVSRGLLALTRSEDEIAGVLGHEIEHVERRHSVRQMRRDAGFGLLALPGEIVGGIVSDDLASLAGKPFEALSAGYSRDQEREADTLGQQVAAAAGYDPLGIATILDHMERFLAVVTTEKRGPSFFDSHPSTPERVHTLMQRAPTLAVVARAPIAAGGQDYLGRLAGLVIGENAAEGVVRDGVLLHPVLGFRLTFPQGWAVDNSRRAVTAIAPAKDGVAVFGLAGKGEATDLPKIAAAFADKLGRKYRQTPQQVEGTTAAGLPAQAVVLTDASGKVPMYLYVLWVVLEGNVYQMVGIGPDAHRPLVRGIVESLRPLTPEERASITELRLHIVTAHAGETLATLAARAGGSAAPAVLAALNGVDANVVYAGGEPVNVPVRTAFATAR